MASSWAQVIASAVLSKASVLRPGSIPNSLDDDGVAEWAECIDMMSLPQIDELWAEAVRDWAINEPNDRMFTPWSLKRAVIRVRDRWEGDLSKRRALTAYREAQVERKHELWNQRHREGVSMLDGSPRQIESGSATA